MPKVPDPILKKISCIKCKKWLSCGPIVLLANGGSVCGRCYKYRQGPRDQYRHFAYEALACYFKFPCKYWEFHCPEALPFKQVFNHESHCVYASACTTFFSHPSAAFKSKRYLDTRAAIKLEVIPDEVLEYLRCGNCASYLSCEPVYVSRDGTSVCHRCSAQLQQPNPEFIRDPAFEAFADMMIFPCIFRYRGCTQYFKFGEHSQEHETECPYGAPYSRDQNQNRESEQEWKHQSEQEWKHQSEQEWKHQSEQEWKRQSEQPQPEKEVKRQESMQHHKERGVIKTHSGHIYATITPNAPVFTRPVKKQQKDMFLDEFDQHRENLASRWGRPDDELSLQEFERPQISNNRYPARVTSLNFSPVNEGPQINRPGSVYENMGYGSDLINELRIKQQLRKPNGLDNNDIKSNGYYTNESEQQKMEYSVYK